jgi:hypothetical protein
MSVDPTREIVEPVGDPEFGPWLAQASLLVVDDEPGIRNFLVKILGPRCRLIEEAADTKEASHKLDVQCQSASNFDPQSASNFDPLAGLGCALPCKDSWRLGCWIYSFVRPGGHSFVPTEIS